MAEAQIVTGSIEAHALARHVRMSPQKARLVMDLIRRQKAPEALQTLQYTQKSAAKEGKEVVGPVGRMKETQWDRKRIRTDSGSATTSRSSRAGTPTRNTPTCCTKMSGCAPS